MSSVIICILEPTRVVALCGSLLTVSTSVSLTMIGIFFTLFTVLHSFIENKKNDLKNIEQEIRLGKDTPRYNSEQKFCREYIQSRRKLNLKFFYTILFSSMLYAYATILELFKIEGVGYYVALLVVDASFVGWLLYVIIHYFKGYFKTIHS